MDWIWLRIYARHAEGCESGPHESSWSPGTGSVWLFFSCDSRGISSALSHSRMKIKPSRWDISGRAKEDEKERLGTRERKGS